ncbi:sulfated surface glycoprotein 185-like [Leguminivora glycinivorella]|uniref:sulfated surface glycoprotein 185-like n=1 Tax=Leguminivora glycinivorella TaxID=1035111 RepID=UPI00200F9DA5|nr:sulfated surface glycoprotein 185-like [Leguminivora glycinivorella]
MYIPKDPSSGYPVCMDSPAPARRRPAAPHSPALRAALAAPGSPALRALFAPRPSPAPAPAPAPAPSPRREPEPAARRPVPPSPAVAAPAPSPPSLLRLALERLTVEPEPRPPAPSPARASSAAPAPAPGAPRARSRDPPRSTVIYSDAIGAGLGVLLGECLRQSVTNVCLRGASVESVVRRLARDKFDSGTTLIIHLGDSVGVKRSHVGSLILATVPAARRAPARAQPPRGPPTAFKLTAETAERPRAKCKGEAQGDSEGLAMPLASIEENSSLAIFNLSGANLRGELKTGGPGVVLIW